MATFKRKNLVTLVYKARRNRILKGLTLFFLGASATLLFVNADVTINPLVSNVVSYLKQVVLTADGTSSSATGVFLDGATSKIGANYICNASGTNCITYATGGNMGINMATPTSKFHVVGSLEFDTDGPASSSSAKFVMTPATSNTGGTVVLQGGGAYEGGDLNLLGGSNSYNGGDVNIIAGNTLGASIRLAGASVTQTRLSAINMNGLVSIGGYIPSDLSLSVFGTGYFGSGVRAAYYCDENGQNCKNMANLTATESDPTVNSLAKANLSCSEGQVVKYYGGAWTCGTLSSTESDPVYTASAAASVTTTRIGNWDTAHTNMHTHANATVLNGIGSDDISSWNTAASNVHNHANKPVLDGITAGDVTNWNTVYGWGNHHTQGYVTSTSLTSTLGSYVTDGELSTALSPYAKTADISASMHTHSNTAYLDSVTQYLSPTSSPIFRQLTISEINSIYVITAQAADKCGDPASSNYVGAMPVCSNCYGSYCTVGVSTSPQVACRAASPYSGGGDATICPGVGGGSYIHVYTAQNSSAIAGADISSLSGSLYVSGFMLPSSGYYSSNGEPGLTTSFNIQNSSTTICTVRFTNGLLTYESCN